MYASVKSLLGNFGLLRVSCNFVFSEFPAFFSGMFCFGSCPASDWITGWITTMLACVHVSKDHTCTCFSGPQKISVP